jgi:hypothetical protein
MNIVCAFCIDFFVFEGPFGEPPCAWDHSIIVVGGVI